MSEKKKRNTNLPEFKAKVSLEAVRGVKTVNQIAHEYSVHPLQVGKWKREIQAQAKRFLKANPVPSPLPLMAHRTGCTVRSGGSRWSSTGSKKVQNQPAMTQRSCIGVDADVTQKCQCVLAGVVRGTV
jgi:transposase-like protein